jgi:hypothetical protein
MPTRSLPLEQAQLLWERALELVDVVDVVRAADHDSTTIAHALALGRTRLRADVTNDSLRSGVTLLARAVAFLGVKPSLNAAEVTGPEA